MEYPTTDSNIKQIPVGDDDEVDECVMSAAFTTKNNDDY